MTKGLAVAPRKTTIARPLKALVPLIQRELQAGTEAGLEHYRRAGEMLLEARAQIIHGSWTGWLKKHFELSQLTASRYMRLAKLAQENPDILRSANNMDYTAVVGDRTPRQQTGGAWRPVLKAARNLDAELFAQERQSEANEVQVHRDLAIQLIDLGYRALATRLHPDQGGSKDAMQRLHRVRDQLKSVAQTRRFV